MTTKKEQDERLADEQEPFGWDYGCKKLSQILKHWACKIQIMDEQKQFWLFTCLLCWHADLMLKLIWTWALTQGHMMETPSGNPAERRAVQENLSSFPNNKLIKAFNLYFHFCGSKVANEPNFSGLTRPIWFACHENKGGFNTWPIKQGFRC